MNRVLIPVLVAMLGSNSFQHQSVMEQSTQRRIAFDPRIPIADRLLPADRDVLVYMHAVPGLVGESAALETFENEIQRLRLTPIIALVRASRVLGELTDGGAWVHTKVNAEVERLIQAPPGVTIGDSIEFEFSGGTTRIGQVQVTAVPSARYAEGDEYLVFLLTRPDVTPALAFRVDPRGLLERLTTNEGMEQSFKTNLVGRNIVTVLNALSK